MAPTASKLPLLEIGRAIAALMVVLHHADQATAHFSSTAQPRLFIWGQYGVDFFFVLSGFIIYYTCKNDPLGSRAASHYAAKRFTRIYLPYLPVALAWVALLVVFQGGDAAQRSWDIWATLTLLPMEKASALTVAWTLTYEIVFYTFFLLFYVSRPLFRTVAVIWVFALLAVAIGLIERPASSPVLNVLLNPIVLLFFCGVVAAYAVEHTPKSMRLPLLGAGLVFGLIVVLTWTGRRELLGPPLTLIVLGAALYEVPKPSALVRGAVFLGAASYAIYLMHSPVISIAAEVLQPLEMRWVVFAVCCMLGTAVGVAYHVAFEKPVQRAAQRAIRSHVAKEVSI